MYIIMVEAPSNVVLTPVGATSFDVTWDRPGDDDMISYKFEVYVREVGKPKYKMVYSTRDYEELEFRVHDLTEGTEYECYVQSFGMYPGDCSPVFKIVTLAGAPRRAPQQLTVIESTTSEILLQWCPPAVSDPDNPDSDPTIDGYKLFYDIEGSGDEFTEIQLPVNVYTTRLTSISHGSVMRIQILAFNSVGDGPESPILRHKMVDKSNEKVVPISTKQLTALALKMSMKEKGKKKKPTAPPPDPKQSGSPEKRPLKLMPSTPGDRPISQMIPDSSTDPVYSLAADVGLGRGESDIDSPGKLSDIAESPSPGPSPTSLRAPSNNNSSSKKPPRVVVPKLNIDEGDDDGVDDGSGLKLLRRQRGSRRAKSRIDRNSWLLLSRSQTIRGKKGAVRKTKDRWLENEKEDKKEITSLEREIQNEREAGQVVLYVTTISTIRDTYSQCQAILKILYNMRIKVLVKDVSMDKAYMNELQERLPRSSVPQLFVKGESVGDYNEVFKMNERGELTLILEGCAMRPMQDCPCCAGTGFMLCTWCRGTKKSTPVSSEFEKDYRKTALKCTVCNENGLERCREC